MNQTISFSFWKKQTFPQDVLIPLAPISPRCQLSYPSFFFCWILFVKGAFLVFFVSAHNGSLTHSWKCKQERRIIHPRKSTQELLLQFVKFSLGHMIFKKQNCLCTFFLTHVQFQVNVSSSDSDYIYYLHYCVCTYSD